MSKSTGAKPAETYIPPSITMTQSAALRVGELIADEQDLSLCLRIFIEGGGCSGFQYGFVFDDDAKEDDTVIEQEVVKEDDYVGPDMVKLIIDPMSFQYLVGSEIDFKDDLQGPRFIIRNPNATTTCGCGSSFAMEPEIEAEDEEKST